MPPRPAPATAPDSNDGPLDEPPLRLGGAWMTNDEDVRYDFNNTKAHFPRSTSLKKISHENFIHVFFTDWNVVISNTSE
jgi:hypothetical protein